MLLTKAYKLHCSLYLALKMSHKLNLYWNNVCWHVLRLHLSLSYANSLFTFRFYCIWTIEVQSQLEIPSKSCHVNSLFTKVVGSITECTSMRKDGCQQGNCRSICTFWGLGGGLVGVTFAVSGGVCNCICYKRALAAVWLRL